eukprot:scaffold2742_cov130-Isochrysis_galbana.AAC.7
MMKKKLHYSYFPALCSSNNEQQTKSNGKPRPSSYYGGGDRSKVLAAMLTRQRSWGSHDDVDVEC